MVKFFTKYPFAKLILHGLSQVMLQENKWTGLLFLIGLFIGSWKFGLAAILAVISGTLTAKFFKYDNDEINAGLYGFSPALTGVALMIVFKQSFLLWLLVIAGGILAAMLQHFFIIRKIPAYTFPFIVVIWTFVFLFRHFLEMPSPELAQSQFVPVRNNYFLAVTNGFGEVIFQENIWSGIIFFIAVFLNNPLAALYGLAASLSGAILSYMNGQSLEEISLGLFGFNAVLTAIVFSGPRKADGLWVLIGSFITIIIHNLLIDSKALDIVGGVFTFPFVAGTWLTLIIQKVINNKV